MQAQRLLENLRAQHDMELEAFFGNPRLVDAAHSTPPFAAVKRVALLTESFLPKVDGVVKTAFLTVRYLQETGREVLVSRRISLSIKWALPRLSPCLRSACRKRRRREWRCRIRWWRAISRTSIRI